MNSGVFHENDNEVIVGTIREKFQHGRNNLACSLSATNNPCCNWGKRRKGLLDKSTKWKRFLVHHFGQNENFQDREFSSPNTSLYFWKHKSFRWRQPNQSLQHTFWGPLAIFAQLDVMRLVVKHNSKRALNGFRTELIQWKENVVPEFRKKKPRNSKNTCPVNQVLHLSACGGASSSTHETCSGLERYPGQGQSQPRHDSACAQPRDLDHFPGHHGRDSDLIVICFFLLWFLFLLSLFFCIVNEESSTSESPQHYERAITVAWYCIFDSPCGRNANVKKEHMSTHTHTK